MHGRLSLRRRERCGELPSALDARSCCLRCECGLRRERHARLLRGLLRGDTVRDAAQRGRRRSDVYALRERRRSVRFRDFAPVRDAGDLRFRRIAGKYMCAGTSLRGPLDEQLGALQRSARVLQSESARRDRMPGGVRLRQRVPALRLASLARPVLGRTAAVRARRFVLRFVGNLPARGTSGQRLHDVSNVRAGSRVH